MSVRDFAKYLGVSDRQVSKWEAGGERLFPQPANQSMLDRALATADPAEQQRFDDLLGAARPDVPAGRRPDFWCQLPPDITDFTGRHDEIDRLVRHVGSREGSGVPIAAIFGKAGVGKTSLAVHVAHQVREHFPDGQLYHTLRGTYAQKLEPSEVLGQFLREFGVDPANIPEDIEDRERLFRAQLSDRRMLIVLDNAGDERQVRPLLPGSAKCAVIVTSRRCLAGLAGTQHCALDVMPLRHGVEFLEAMMTAERARTDPEATEEIVTLCGALPLALRIVGARLSARPSGSMVGFAERLRDERSRLDELRAGDLEVRASFELSYNSCPEDVRRAFRLLGMVDATNFPAWVLAVMLDEPVSRAESLLEQLVDAELIETAAEELGVRRYRFHDLLRLFAHERLVAEPQSRAEAARRLLDEYLRLCVAATALVEPGGPVVPEPCLPEALKTVERNPDDWFRSERSGLLTAVTLASGSQLWQHTWRLAEQVGIMLRRQSAWIDWDRTLEVGLAAATISGSREGEARIRGSFGQLLRDQGRFNDALAELHRSAELFAELDDNVELAVAHSRLGQTYQFTGNLREGVAKFQAALPVLEHNGNARLTAGTLCGLGDIFRGLSRWDESVDCLERAIGLYAELGDLREKAISQVRLGIVWRDRCRHAEAEQLYRNGWDTFREFGDRRWEAQLSRHLGVLYRNWGRWDEAMDCLDAAHRTFAEQGDRRSVAVTLRNIGDTDRRRGDFAAAARHLDDALARFQEVGDIRWQARTVMSLADGDAACDREADAIDRLDHAYAVFSDIHDDPGRARVHRSRGIAHRRAGRYDRSLAEFRAGRDLFSALGDQIWAARALAGSAETLKLAGDDSWVRAREQAERACVAAGAASASEACDWLFEW